MRSQRVRHDLEIEQQVVFVLELFELHFCHVQPESKLIYVCPQSSKSKNVH